MTLLGEAIELSPLAVADEQLDHLDRRLADARWPDPETSTSQGPRLEQVRALCDYWATGYDWRRCERAINEMGSFRTVLNDLGVHFLHVRSPEPSALPLLLCHGWPGSILEFRRLIGPLTDPVSHGGRAEDAFHLVIPSMPGFGFSDKPTSTGWGVSRIADTWIDLMKRLGYDAWAAHGGDWGSAIVEAISRKRPQGLLGMHVNLPIVMPTDEEVTEATPDEQRMIAKAQAYHTEMDGYAKEQSTRPQTIGYSLADSPIGLAAWIYTVFQDVSDSDGEPETVVDRDDILDDVMMYWLPNAGASSARLYWEARREDQFPVEPNPTPAGFSIFPGEAIQASRRWIERRYSTVLRYHRLDRGGHFAALEQPTLLTDEIRATFRAVR